MSGGLKIYNIGASAKQKDEGIHRKSNINQDLNKDNSTLPSNYYEIHAPHRIGVNSDQEHTFKSILGQQSQNHTKDETLMQYL